MTMETVKLGVRSTLRSFQILFLLVLIQFFQNGVTGSGEEAEPSECFKAPNVCPNENITFWLYKDKDNPQKCTEINVKNPAKIGILMSNRKNPVVILIHGLGGYTNDSFNQQLRLPLLKRDFYVISVQWSPLSIQECRKTSAENTPVVGHCTAQLIDLLIKKRFDRKSIKVIGFSVGAHSAGFIQQYSKAGKPYRITGLDPPLEFFPANDTCNRLDDTDADYVDCHHCSVGSIGAPYSCGDVDVFYNCGGRQPGCEKEETNPKASGLDLCDHFRCPALYAESIDSKSAFWGRQCEYDDTFYTLKDCMCKKRVLVGYRVSVETQGFVEVPTNDKAPFDRCDCERPEDCYQCKSIEKIEPNKEANEIS